ncbi:MAG: virulence factor protein [Deltaproteobacteria bacterium]|nr:virulence factor protein [Deltaproteobacteria bacterium]
MEQKISDIESSHTSTTDIIKKGSVITIITMISRPLGYIREAIQAYLFGATLLVDAFIVAFNFPELIQTLFFSGATSAFLVPVCVRYMKDHEEYSSIYSTFINLAIIIAVSISLLFLAFSHGIINVIAPGFSSEAKHITRILFVIMLPVISLHTILSVIKAFLNAKEHFAAPELSGIIWNIAFILSALFLRDRFGIYSLAIGVTIGSFLQIGMQIPYLRQFNVRYRMTLNMQHPALIEAKNLFTGALIATSIVPINSFVGRVIASYLPHGEVAALSYAFRIFILPFSLFAVPIYTVMFTKLSKLFHNKDWQGINAHIDSSMVLIAITLIPCTVLLCSVGDAVIRLLYERGAFTMNDTLMTNRALFGYSVGLIFYALSISFVRIFNSLHDMKTPAIVGITSIAINAILASILMIPLKNFGIALATSIVSFYNFVMLYVLLKKKIGYSIKKGTIREISQSLLAGIILLLSITLTRKIITESTYPLLGISIVLTAIIYGIFFKHYYLSFLKKSR